MSLYRAASAGATVIFVAATIVFFDAFYGDFFFSGFSDFSNSVQIRDKDFYRPSIDLGMLLLLLLIGLVSSAKNFALRSKTDK
jgi:hypothetical protein